MTRRNQAELALAAVTLLWGATFVVVKSAVDQISTLLFVTLRFTLGALVLVLVFRGRLLDRADLRRVTLGAGTAAGACLVVAYFFQTLGLRYTTPSKSAFITGLSTALVPFLAAIVYRGKPHLSEAAGIGIATAGMALLTLPAGAFVLALGDALTLCCSIVFAAHILVLARWSPVTHFPLLATLQVAVTAVLAGMALWLVETPVFTPSPAVLTAIGFTGVFATALAFTVMTWAQRHTSATRAALIFALEPVSAAVTSYLAEGERFTGRSFGGALLVLAGVLMVELKPIGAARHPQR